jgi:hypothetical protein
VIAVAPVTSRATSNQMQGTIDAFDLTGTPPHRRLGAEALFNAPLTKTEQDIANL